MLLALGPLQLDPTVRTVVVALVTDPATVCAERVAAGADALWLLGPATPDEVADAHSRTGLPVGVTVDARADLADLVAAGAIAVEAGAAVDVTEQARAEGVCIWCTPADARRAIKVGVPPEQIVVEGGDAGDPGFAGATVPGEGPATWGAVLRSRQDGACVVRTADVRSVRRVVAVADRLVAARAGGRGEARS